MDKLTEKQKMFCEEYLIDLNATQAAIRAGYSEKTAKEIASENLTKPHIQKYIEELMTAKKSSLIATQDEVLEYLTAVMRREKKEHVVVTVMNEVTEYVPDENGVARKTTRKMEEPKIVQIPAKLSDANKAAELLGKRYMLFTEKVALEADMDLNINIDYGEE